MSTEQTQVDHHDASASGDLEAPAGIDFLDFLFTVAISVGLTPEIIGQAGLLSESWHSDGRWPNSDEWFDICVFFLGFINLTLSWFGYHASIKSKPLNFSSAYGMVRFNIDVVLVVLYGIMLIEYERLNVVIAVLIVVHLIFVIWDVLKVQEHKEKYKGTDIWRFRREFVSVFAYSIVMIVSVFHFAFQMNRWIIIILAISITIFYRFNKYQPTWERLFGYKGD